jgi:hypothetical protein
MAELNQQVVDNFEIPEDLAKELSELLVKQTIRERILLQLVTDPDKFEEVEKSLVPITAKIEAIKNRITKEFVPDEYNSTKYMWNYESWEVARNKVQVIELY